MITTERVRVALVDLGIDAEVLKFAAGTATADDAAAAAGCHPGRIVKTLLFMADGRPTLVLVAGDRQVDTSALAAVVGVGRKRLRMATALEVFERTGYPVGGLAPVGAVERADVVVDESLRRFDRVWAAAGAPNAMFNVATSALVNSVEGQWAAITRGPG